MHRASFNLKICSAKWWLDGWQANTVPGMLFRLFININDVTLTVCNHCHSKTDYNMAKISHRFTRYQYVHKIIMTQ